MNNDALIQNPKKDSRFIIYIKGFCMGAADVVPGVSGGTMALILNIYPRLINAIKSFDLAWLSACFRLQADIIKGRPHWYFIIPLVAGIITALFFFTRIISLPELIQTHPEAVYGLFFGLILGSIIVLIPESGKLSVKKILSLAIGTSIGLYIFNLIPAETPETAWFVFIAGALAISAMILPGISGSFILLMLKKYSYIFNAIGHLDFLVLIPFTLGIITGLALFSRVLAWLLDKYYEMTLLLITGLLVASLWIIWPFQLREYQTVANKQYLIHSTPIMPDSLSQEVLLAIMLIITGLVTVMAIHFMANRISTGHSSKI